MRRQIRFHILLLPLAAGVLLLGACVAPPVQEMSDARQAITAAEAAGAREHAPETLKEAQAWLSRAETKLQGHSYREARRAAVEAKLRAAEALKASEGSTPGDR